MIEKDRVGCSRFVQVVSALLWLVCPTGYPTLLAVVVVIANWEYPEELLDPALISVTALTNLLSWWGWWRYAGVSATRRPDGLRVRGMWRTREVPWPDLLDVAATEYSTSGRSFRFGHTIVTVAGASEPRDVVVSRSYRMGRAGYDTILSWLPQRHPLAASAPRAQAVPAGTDAGIDDQPVTARLPASTALRAIYLVLVAGVGGGAAYGIGAALARVEQGGGWWVLVAGLLPVLVGAVWILTWLMGGS